MMAWLCDMRSTWLWWPKCNQVWAWLESGLAYPSIARMSMAKRSFHSMAQYLGFVKAPEKDGRDYSVVFEVGFKMKWFISSSPDCQKKNQMLDLLATKAVKPQRLVDLRGCLFCRQHGWNDSICIQELTMEIGITSRIPTLCRIQGWILWENARLLKDDTRPCRFGCYAWWRFSWGQGSYNTSGECWEVEGPSLWDSVRSVRVSGFAVNESHKFTLGPALAASTFRRIPLKEESNLWRKAILLQVVLESTLVLPWFQSNMPV